MKVLVIAAHPDDETLGCGGTLLKHRAEKSSLYWIVATSPHPPQYSARTIDQKAAEVRKVAQAYRVEKYFKLGFPAARLDTIPKEDLIGKIRDVSTSGRTYLVHGGDVHTDHQAVFTAGMSVLKPLYMKKYGVRRILCYETLSSTEAAPANRGVFFRPNVFSDITRYLDRKVEIMSIYRTEIQKDPLPRGPSAIRALARYRGAAIGVESAEAFELVREFV